MTTYRTGMDRTTGKLLRGHDHLQQSIAVIVTTLLTERVMRLDFGAELIRKIGRNLSKDFVVTIYRDVITAIHRWEPEFRVRRVQLVALERTGVLGIALAGTYYPEGRLGNYGPTEETLVNVALVTTNAGVA